MRAAVFDAAKLRVEVATMSVPQPTSDDLLIRVCRCGICGSDVAMTAEAPFTLPAGQFGHEYAGEVVEVGQNVSSHKPGDRVAAIPMLPCGKTSPRTNQAIV